MATASKWTQTCLHHCANACAIIKGDNDPDGQGPADDSNGGGGGSATLKHFLDLGPVLWIGHL